MSQIWSSLREVARALDSADPLAQMRAEFLIPEGLIYLDGNSLGPLGRGSHAAVERALTEEWGNGLITSWNEASWIDLGQRSGNLLAGIIGAEPESVGIGDSISVNLFKIAAAALALNPSRTKIITEIDNFPSDIYVLDGVAKTFNKELRTLAKEEILDALDDDVAILELSHIDYRSARIWDMKEVTERAHEVGALVIWDLAHSAGCFPVELATCHVDFAIGCGYKFLNGGPGAPAFWYVAPRHQPNVHTPIQGWFGHAAPFAFDLEYCPAEGASRFLAGTPPVLSTSSLHAALELFATLDMHQVRAKSVALTSFAQELAEEHLIPRGFGIFTERDSAKRGSHISFTHPAGYAIIAALIERKIIGDFRRPDVLRFGLVPLYNSFDQVVTLIETISELIDSGAHLNPRYATESRVI